MNDAPGQTHEPAGQAPEPALRAGHDRLSLLLFVVATLGVLAADLAIKYAAFAYVAGEPVVLDPERPERPGIPPHEPVTVIPGLLSLRLTTNTGAVFGVWQGGKWFFIAVSVVAIVLIARIFARSPARAYAFHLALALILAGALGNLYDRYMYSAVRDMLHLFPGWRLPFGLTWPGNPPNPTLYPWIFNLADAALIVGVLGVLLITWLNELRRPAAQTAAG